MAKKIKRDQNKAVVYIRVSSEKQAVSGLGLQDQTERCEAYCKMKGLKIVGTFRDEGVSAGKPIAKRPAGRDMLDALKRSGAGAVIILKLDRAFRNALDCLVNVESWERSGIFLHIVDMGGNALDTSSAMGKMFLTMSAAFAEMERTLISERTKAGMGVKKSRGERVGRVPFGKRLGSNGKTLEDCPGEMACLDRIRYFKREGYSVRSIAGGMNAIGYTNRGKPWTKSAVGRLLAR